MAMVKHRSGSAHPQLCSSRAYGVTAHPLSTKHTSQSLYTKPPPPLHANRISVNGSVSSRNSDTYKRNTYMKLLKSNDGDSNYERLLIKLTDPRELSELTVSGIDSVLEHPKEWCKDTQT